MQRPQRQQALYRNPQQPYQHLPIDRHGCHFFCSECFKRTFLGTAAFKLYLLVAWCLGLAGLMYLQKPGNKQVFAEQDAAAVVALLVYLVSQLFGLLAVVTQIERIFIPYSIVLIIVTIGNIVVFALEMSKVVSRLIDFGIFGDTHLFFACVFAIFLFYNIICMASVIHLCSHFDKKRLLTIRRRREALAHNARIYSRLVELNNRDQPVSVNLDSPPKYLSVVIRPDTVCTPPPGYSQLKTYPKEEEEEKGEEKTSRRSLFKN
uniref:MARVEL domain-containing protein n=1 Tax=Caenorhabditis tropicalis TaxID=1561998 RepID=A0A1I7V4J6_9PELO